MGVTFNPFSLEGKTILVTGASSGIGRQTAIHCSKMGASVIITGRNEDRLNETFLQLEDEGHKKVISELTNDEDVKRLVSSVDSLDGAVFCAGKVCTSPFKFSTQDKYDDVFAVNYFSQVQLLRLLLKGKKIAREASIVFLSSVGGNERVTIGNGIYNASKAALTCTMRICAKELASMKIRVNSVHPGMVNTAMTTNGGLEAVSEEQKKIDLERYPLKRFGEPEDIANGIIYLLSNASSWVTGHALVIDGGISI